MAFNESSETIRGKMIDMAEQIRETARYMKEVCEAKEVDRFAPLSTHLAYLGSVMTRLTVKYKQALDQHQEFNQSRITISPNLPISLPYEPLTPNGRPQIQSRKRPHKRDDGEDEKDIAQSSKRRSPQAKSKQNTNTGPSSVSAPSPPYFPGPYFGAYPYSNYPGTGNTGSDATTCPGPSYFAASGETGPGQDLGSNWNGNTSAQLSDSATDEPYFDWEQACDEEPLSGGSAAPNNLFFSPKGTTATPNPNWTQNNSPYFNSNGPYQSLRNYATDSGPLPWTNVGAHAPYYTTPEPNGAKPFGSDECSICLDSLDDGRHIVGLGCEHRFHAVCIAQWKIREKQCPICRRPM